MKSNLLSFLLVFLCVRYTQAQTGVNTYSTKIDSIQQLLDKRSAVDTLRVIQLNNLAHVCFRDLQFKRGLVATKEARTLAKKLNYEKGEGLYLLTLRDFNEDSFLWFYYNYKAIWFYVDRHEYAPTTSLIPAPASQSTNAEKAMKALQTALAYFEQNADAEITANILQLISYNYRMIDKDGESIPYLDKAFEKFQEAKLPATAYYLLTYKSFFLDRSGKKQESKLAQQKVNKFIVANPNNRETALIYSGVSNFYFAKKDFPSAFELNSKANLLLERLGEQHLRILILERLGGLYFYTLDLPNKSLEFFLKEKILVEAVHDKENLARIYQKVAFNLIKLKRFKEAIQYIGKAEKIINNSPDSYRNKKDLSQHYDALGQIFMVSQKYQEAISNFKQAVKIDSILGYTGLSIYFNMYIAQCYWEMGNFKESINYGLRSYEDASSHYNTYPDSRYVIPRVCRLLFENYDSLKKPLEAYKFLKIEYKYRKDIEERNAANRLAEMEIQSIVLKSEQEKNRLEQARLLKEKENQNQRWWLFSIAAALFSSVVLIVIFYRNNQHKQKANNLLHRQKEEIDHQRHKAENAFVQLQSTQAQLIQKEKLASLGELTAGIAHEIQNPLNFVNNFSEVSTELIDELKEGPFQKLPDDEKLYAEEILGDLTSNLKKISHHGGRASSIVKGMLEHSRTDSGEKRPTDLNALADEYLKIAYHGMRAKNKEFNCELVTHFDPTLEPVTVAPQEIGRVLLNLYNNAFYALSEKAKKTSDPDYKPTVTVSTKQEFDQVVIRVSDNGTGISESVKAKIFQPFFTTKPTGEGTGLGLSLSYDIITKGHKGTLGVESQSGAGTEFIIHLPVIS
ncbi:hypothetical protein GCM10027592_53250 [Spirosoma flavus]